MQRRARGRLPGLAPGKGFPARSGEPCQKVFSRVLLLVFAPKLRPGKRMAEGTRACSAGAVLGVTLHTGCPRASGSQSSLALVFAQVSGVGKCRLTHSEPESLHPKSRP